MCPHYRQTLVNNDSLGFKQRFQALTHCNLMIKALETRIDKNINLI